MENDPPKVELEGRIGNTDLRSLKVERSVASSVFKIAQDRFRMMEVEREILSHAIRRLYEAEANGKISKDELKNLLSTYKQRMIQVKNTMQHDQSIVALYNLECIQSDLIGVFNKHFDDLNKKIGELKARLDIEPVTTFSSKEKKKTRRKRQKRKRPSSTNEKSKVDKKIEQIRAMIEETQERLSKIEIET